MPTSGANGEPHVEQAYQPADDAQAEPIAVMCGVGGDANLEELIIDVGYLRCRNADTGVEHLEAQQRRITRAKQ